MKYAFIKRHEQEHSVRRMCKVMQVHPSGYYAWKAQPHSPRAKDDQRLTGLLKQAWLESGGVYGYRKLTLDMRDLGERCGKHRVARLLKTLRRLAGEAPRRRTQRPAASSWRTGRRRAGLQPAEQVLARVLTHRLRQAVPRTGRA